MKVEHQKFDSNPHPIPAPEASRAQTFYPTTESTLVSPHAPSLPRLSSIISSIWNWIRSFFAKPEPKAGPSPEALQAIEKALAEKKASSETLLDRETVAIGLAGAGLCYWQWERVSTFAMAIPGHLMKIPSFIGSMIPTIIAIQGTSALKTRVERTARGYFPSAIPTWMIRGASAAVSSAAVWYSFRWMGYGLGQAYLGYLSGSTFQGIPAMAASLLSAKAADYAEQETILWAISALNVARFAQLSFSPSPPPPHTKTTS